MNAISFDDFFKNAPASIDVPAIREYWQALSPFYDVADWRLPLPPWQHRPFDDSGEEAWHVLRHDLNQADSTQPFCIYLHIPFCSSKCGFCDSYSFKLGSQQEKIISRYVERLCYELRLWSQQGNLAQRPVTTVHMGGGTPTFIGTKAIRQIVECCKECFSILPDTEWALESTVHNLTLDMMETLHDLGYRRLHLGVQSLEDRVRSVIGRRNPASDVLKTIELTKAAGWIVSVDLLCGLPHQTLSGFMKGLEKLDASGINGFSLYELLVYPQNRRWATRHQVTGHERHVPNFWMFLSGADFLERKGYRKNLFNHWADEQDKNIYFTFPSRGEDLLAVGAIADGVFGNYHYRHPRYAPYMAGSVAGLPGLEGGLRRRAESEKLVPLRTAILAGSLNAEQVAQLRHVPAYAQLFDRWVKARLVSHTVDSRVELTGSGAWFAGNLVNELALATPSPSISLDDFPEKKAEVR